MLILFRPSCKQQDTTLPISQSVQWTGWGKTRPPYVSGTRWQPRIHRSLQALQGTQGVLEDWHITCSCIRARRFLQKCRDPQIQRSVLSSKREEEQQCEHDR